MNESIRAWLRLIRLPNLLTVPGDALVGFALAGGFSSFQDGAIGRLGYAVCASLMLYVSGLILNDVFDSGVDAKERPSRPIPSGVIPLRSAIFVFFCAALAAMNLAVGAGGALRSAPFAIALFLLGAIVVYDSPLRRRFPLAGLALMGACRALNVVLGASVVIGLGTQHVESTMWALDILKGLNGCVLAATATVFLFVIAFSALARREADSSLPQNSPLFAMPFAAVVVGIIPAVVFIAVSASNSSSADSVGNVAPLLAVFAAAITALHAFLLWRSYPKYVAVPNIIGRHVQNLLRIQAAFLLASGSVQALVLGGMLFLCAPLFARLGKAFPAS